MLFAAEILETPRYGGGTNPVQYLNSLATQAVDVCAWTPSQICANCTSNLADILKPLPALISSFLFSGIKGFTWNVGPSQIFESNIFLKQFNFSSNA